MTQSPSYINKVDCFGFIPKLLDANYLLESQESKDLMSILGFMYESDKKRKWRIIDSSILLVKELPGSSWNDSIEELTPFT